MQAKIRVECTDTFMIWADEYHLETGDKRWTCYLKVPDEWLEEQLQERCTAVLQAVYVDWRRQTMGNPDNDLGYYLLKDVACEVVTAVPLSLSPPWHDKTCYRVTADGSYQTIASSDF